MQNILILVCIVTFTHSFDSFLQSFIVCRFWAAVGLGFFCLLWYVDLFLLSLSWGRNLFLVLLLSDLLETLKYCLRHLYVGCCNQCKRSFCSMHVKRRQICQCQETNVLLFCKTPSCLSETLRTFCNTRQTNHCKIVTECTHFETELWHIFSLTPQSRPIYIYLYI